MANRTENPIVESFYHVGENRVMLTAYDHVSGEISISGRSVPADIGGTIPVLPGQLRPLAAFLIRAAERREAQAAAAPAPAECTAVASDEELPPADILTTTGVI